MIKREQYLAALLTAACVVVMVLAFQAQGFGEQARENNAQAKMYQNKLKIEQAKNQALRKRFEDTCEDRDKCWNTAVLFCGRWQKAEGLILVNQKARYEELKRKLDETERKVSGETNQQQSLSSRGTSRSVESVGAAGHGEYLGEFVATAYNGQEQNGGGSTTANGTNVGPGTIAVDKRLIPLGTELYIEGYGEGTALDTGSAIVGRRIDVWLPLNQVNAWGRKSVKVWKR